MCKRLLSCVLIVVMGTISCAQIVTASSYGDALVSSISEVNPTPEETASEDISEDLFDDDFDEQLEFEDDSNLATDSLITSDTFEEVPAPVPESEDEAFTESFPDCMEEEISPVPEEGLPESVESLPEMELSTESEILVGSSAYQLQVQWLDGGSRSFALGSFQSSSNAMQSAAALLTKIGLYDRCSISCTGTNIIAKVKKVAQSTGSPIVIAHAGYAKSAPENTLSSVRMAAAYGYTDVEFDVRFTKDKIPVLSHDTTVNVYGRNPDGSMILPSIYLKDYTYAQLQKYDFGIRRGVIWKGEKMATLEDALRICQKCGMRPNLDIKWESWVTYDMLGTIYNLIENYGFHSNVNYISNALNHLKFFTDRDPDALYTLIVYDATKDFIPNAIRLQELANSQIYVYIHEWQLTEGIARTLRFHNFRLNTAVKTQAQIAKLDKWVSSISAASVTPNVVRTEAAKRKSYSVVSYDGDIQIGKDYGFYPLLNCGVYMHMVASRIGRQVTVSNDNSIAEMNAFRFKPAPEGRFYILSTRCMFALAQDASGKVILKESSPTDMTVQWDIILNPNKTYSFVNASTGGFLAISSISSGSALVVSNNAQEFRTQFFLAFSPNQVSVRFEGGRFNIRPFLNEKYAIGVKGGSLKENANVHITTKNKEYRAQHFYVVYSGDGYYRLINEYSGKCLEMKNGYVVQTTWDNKSSQRWKIAWQCSTSLYTIECKSGGKMNVKDSKLAAGTLVNKATVFKGNPYQKWYLRYD